MHAWAYIPCPTAAEDASILSQAQGVQGLHWTPEYGGGGEAFNYTLKSLRNKLHNLWGVHYGYRSRSRSLSRE